MEKLIVEKIVEITEAIKGVAPKVWRIMLRQAYAEASAHAVGFILSLIVLIVGIKMIKNDGVEGIILLIFGIIGIVMCAINATLMFINPEYYAIQSLIP